VTALAICRFAHFLAAMLAFGASAFLAFDAPADLRHALAPGIRRLAVAASLIALATGGLWLSLQTASMADDWRAATDPGAIAAVLTRTGFGRAWVLHLGLAAAFVAAALFAPRDGWGAIAALSGLTLASLGLVGHAAMQAGALGVLHRANHALHLLAAGAWIGGLIPFVLSLDAYARNVLRRDAVTAMMRFSFSGHFVVAAIVATGLANIALTSGRAPLPPTTPYRALLDVKLGLVAMMIGLAIVNRYALVPRLRRSPDALSGLRAISLVNVALGTLVVALVSVFALLDPK
jgi:putative copper resistance protein D